MNGRTDRQTIKRAGRWGDELADRQVDTRTDAQIDEWVGGHTGGRTDGRMDGWINEGINEPGDRWTHSQIYATLVDRRTLLD